MSRHYNLAVINPRMAVWPGKQHKPPINHLLLAMLLTLFLYFLNCRHRRLE